MPHIHGNRRGRRTAAALLILPAALGLAACGGSSKGSSSATAASATAKSGGNGRFAVRASALRTCLQKEGITLPKRPSGQGGPPGGAPGGGPYGAPGGGPYGAPGDGQPGVRGPFGSGTGRRLQLPKGVTRAQFEAALKKCGGDAFAQRRFDSAQGRERFAKFAECMRKNGVDLPAPNTSGKGPIFSTKGIDTNGRAFKTADAKCIKELRPSGTAGTPSGTPPGGEASPGAAGPGAAPPEGPPAGA